MFQGSGPRARRIAKVAIGLSAGAIVLAQVVAVANPAAAATIGVTVSCQPFDWGTSNYPVTNITAAQGDTVAVAVDASCTEVGDVPYAELGLLSNPGLYFSNSADFAPMFGPIPFEFVISATAPIGTMAMQTWLPLVGDNMGNGASLRFTVTSGASESSGAASQDFTVRQEAVGRSSATASCPAGWGASWQSWAVPVTGGWVCVRETYAYYPDIPVS